jgi:hypothetical protein
VAPSAATGVAVTVSVIVSLRPIHSARAASGALIPVSIGSLLEGQRMETKSGWPRVRCEVQASQALMSLEHQSCFDSKAGAKKVAKTAASPGAVGESAANGNSGKSAT